MANKLYDETSIQNIADAIRSKGVSGSFKVSQMASAIENIPTGGVGVHFLDYDGSEVTFWSISEVSSKTELPDNPTHTGLVAEGWNWTLSSIKNYAEKYDNTDVYVGQIYHTSSGLSEFDINVTKVSGLTVTFSTSGTKNWGDGTSDTATTHTYSDYGKYTISCDATAYDTYVFQSGGGPDRLCSAIRFGEHVTRLGNNACRGFRTVDYVIIPSSVTSLGETVFRNTYFKYIALPRSIVSAISTSAFEHVYGLDTVSLPDTITKVSQYMFRYCYTLHNITIPDSVTWIKNGAFSECYALRSVINVPANADLDSTIFNECHGLQEVNFYNDDYMLYNSGNLSSIFYKCHSLTKIKMPTKIPKIAMQMFNTCYAFKKLSLPGCTEIRDYAFRYCYSLEELDFSNCTQVPTLSGYAFQELYSLLRIIVPDSLYEDWITATNWANYANYIYKASEVTD